MSYGALRSVVVANQAEIIMALVFVCLVELVMIIALNKRHRRLSELLDRLITGIEPPTFQDALTRLFERIEHMSNDVRSLQRSIEELSEKQLRCLQHIGIVRFDAFQGVGGRQSFSLAVLDGRGNGAVITSLFGRQESRCFAKPIIGGKSPLRLTEEELEAMRLATSSGSEAGGEIAYQIEI
ncbi:MAG: DUF4446 family protein [Armatimonadota bacterium]|nr:DUF4446 family protein [Armatimonadota bacterium]MCX7778422.1 DUF4446 family protein [Armatimonadota bacterium]MDW8025767.1 DUF4446 family protein [Armatimonadota bacterium]